MKISFRRRPRRGEYCCLCGLPALGFAWTVDGRRFCHGDPAGWLGVVPVRSCFEIAAGVDAYVTVPMLLRSPRPTGPSGTL